MLASYVCWGYTDDCCRPRGGLASSPAWQGAEDVILSHDCVLAVRGGQGIPSGNEQLSRADCKASRFARHRLANPALAILRAVSGRSQTLSGISCLKRGRQRRGQFPRHRLGNSVSYHRVESVEPKELLSERLVEDLLDHLKMMLRAERAAREEDTRVVRIVARLKGDAGGEGAAAQGHGHLDSKAKHRV